MHLFQRPFDYLDVEFMYTNIDNEQGLDAVDPQVFPWSADISKLQCYLFRLKDKLDLPKRPVGGQCPKWWWHHYKKGCWPSVSRRWFKVSAKHLLTMYDCELDVIEFLIWSCGTWCWWNVIEMLAAMT